MCIRDREEVARGLLALADTLKPNSFESVQQLQKQGLEVVMLTGDNPRTAHAIAQQAGIQRDCERSA